MTEIEQRIKALKRPDPIKAKYLIEAELDDLVALFEQAELRGYELGVCSWAEGKKRVKAVLKELKGRQGK